MNTYQLTLTDGSQQVILANTLIQATRCANQRIITCKTTPVCDDGLAPFTDHGAAQRAREDKPKPQQWVIRAVDGGWILSHVGRVYYAK